MDHLSIINGLKAKLRATEDEALELRLSIASKGDTAIKAEPKELTDLKDTVVALEGEVDHFRTMSEQLTSQNKNLELELTSQTHYTADLKQTIDSLQGAAKVKANGAKNYQQKLNNLQNDNDEKTREMVSLRTKFKREEAYRKQLETTLYGKPGAEKFDFTKPFTTAPPLSSPSSLRIPPSSHKDTCKKRKPAKEDSDYENGDDETSPPKIERPQRRAKKLMRSLALDQFDNEGNELC